MADLIKFTMSEDPEASGRRFDAFLETHRTYERMTAARRLWVHVLAIAGGGLFIDAWWPTLWSASVRDATVALWAVSVVGAVAAGCAEWKWYRREAALLARSTTVERLRVKS